VEDKEILLLPAPDNAYITPVGTPEFESRNDIAPNAVQPRTKRATSTSLVGIDPANILDSKRTRHATYLVDVQDIQPLSVVRSAFSAVIQQHPPALHCDQLLPPPWH
jgi:hypothetical protein